MSRPRTPLRRVSRGSLSALARSGSYPDAPVGLGFLEPALSSLVDETETLATNLDALRELEESLKDFNEGFASYLYAMKMNAFVTEWHQVPSDESFKLAQERMAHLLGVNRREQAASGSTSAPQGKSTANSEADKTTYTEAVTGDSTFTHANVESSSAPSAGTKKVVKKSKVVLSAKEKKERNIIMESAINALPLEFRGSDPTLRRNAENVIEGLLSAVNGDGVKLTDLIRPDCNQARVNKCLIALVNRKIVAKLSNAGQVWYKWVGVPQ